MADRRLTDTQWAELLREDDAFKLAIRAQTAIEAEIDAAIADAFDGAVPRELRGTSARFEIRLALTVGLGVIPQELRPPFKAMALRNDFAHGKISDLTPARARELIVAARAGVVSGDEVPPEIQEAERYLQAAKPIMSLRWLMMACRAIARTTAEMAQKRRSDERRIVANYRAGEAGRLRLIESLLAEQEPGPTGDATGEA